MTYEEAVAYIESVPKFTSKNEPSNTVELMRRLGRPERSMKIIHVAGTNGKGSVCAFVSSMLTAGGKKTGLFTSPHLVRINERFQIDQEIISDEEFLEAYENVWEAIQAMQKDGFAHPAYFELLFAVGMCVFKKHGVEYLVMETGLGGRLDATNIVEHPIAVILTSISLDHTEYLGGTVAEIAAEKAGIIKEGVPVIYDGRCEEAERVILKRADQMHAPVTGLHDGMYEILGKTDKSIDFTLKVGYYLHRTFTVPFPADYQAVNASLALLAMEVIDKEQGISIDQRAQALANSRWPGRMETVLPGVIVDGAHNADGVKAFVRTLEETRAERVVLLFSAVSDKDYPQMIEKIAATGRLSEVIVTEIQGSRNVPAGKLAEVFKSHTDVPVTEEADIRRAFQTALERRRGGLLFCVGSLYLIGEIKGIIGEKNTCWITKRN